MATRDDFRIVRDYLLRREGSLRDALAAGKRLFDSAWNFFAATGADDQALAATFTVGDCDPEALAEVGDDELAVRLEEAERQYCGEEGMEGVQNATASAVPPQLVALLVEWFRRVMARR